MAVPVEEAIAALSTFSLEVSPIYLFYNFSFFFNFMQNATMYFFF